MCGLHVVYIQAEEDVGDHSTLNNSVCMPRLVDVADWKDFQTSLSESSKMWFSSVCAETAVT